MKKKSTAYSQSPKTPVVVKKAKFLTRNNPLVLSETSSSSCVVNSNNGEFIFSQNEVDYLWPENSPQRSVGGKKTLKNQKSANQLLVSSSPLGGHDVKRHVSSPVLKAKVEANNSEKRSMNLKKLADELRGGKILTKSEENLSGLTSNYLNAKSSFLWPSKDEVNISDLEFSDLEDDEDLCIILNKEPKKDNFKLIEPQETVHLPIESLKPSLTDTKKVPLPVINTNLFDSSFDDALLATFPLDDIAMACSQSQSIEVELRYNPNEGSQVILPRHSSEPLSQNSGIITNSNDKVKTKTFERHTSMPTKMSVFGHKRPLIDNSSSHSNAFIVPSATTGTGSSKSGKSIPLPVQTTARLCTKEEIEEKKRQALARRAEAIKRNSSRR